MPVQQCTLRFYISLAEFLSQQLLYLGRNGLAIGTTGQALGGNTHHLAHILGTGSTHFDNDGTEFGLQFLGR